MISLKSLFVKVPHVSDKHILSNFLQLKLYNSRTISLVDIFPSIGHSLIQDTYSFTLKFLKSSIISPFSISILKFE